MIIIVSLGSILAYYFLAGAFILWLILAIFGGSLVDQAVTISNFVISILFLIGAIIEMIMVLKTEKKKSLVIIEAIVLIAFAIYGFLVPYNDMIFHHSYVPWASLIETTWVPAFLINVINMYLLEEEFSTTIGASIALTIFGFFLGQVGTIGLCLTTGIENTRNLFNHISYYDNRNYASNENDKDPLEILNSSLERFQKDLVEQGKESDSKAIIEHLTNDALFRESYLQEYGYDCRKSQILTDYNILYQVINKRTNKLITYYFDAEKNCFEAYTKEEIIKIEKELASKYLKELENIAKIVTNKKLSTTEIDEYIKKNNPELFQIFNAYSSRKDMETNIYIVEFQNKNTSDIITINLNQETLEIISSEYFLNEDRYQ